jgi:probable HAF family extracellular repeat protein
MLTNNAQVWATFVRIPSPRHTLSVRLTGTAVGRVTSQPAGIDCGAVCSASFLAGDGVSLTPMPSSGAQFAGWSGACSGMGACSVSMSNDQTVSASFQPAPPPPLAYTITELPGVDGVSDLTPTGINTRGHISGYYYQQGSPRSFQRAFLYDASTGVTRRIASNDHSSTQTANGINDSMAVALSNTVPAGGSRPSGFLWKDEIETSIGNLPPGPNGPMSEAIAINQSGWIAGWSLGSKNWQRAVLWDGSTLTDLGSANDTWSMAKAINASGVVVGATNIAGSTDNHPAVFENGTVRDLGTLGGGGFSSATGISDKGRVVGSSPAVVSGKSEVHAFVYDLPNGPMVDLSPGRSCSAAGVNNAGDVVGSCGLNNQSGARAALWKSGVLYDLNDLTSDPSWVLQTANAVNGSGQIVGVGQHLGQPRGFVLTPR